jgi:hypothetical protein
MFMGTSGQSRAGLAEPAVMIPRPFGATIVDPQVFENAPLICIGFPAGPAETVDPEQLPEAILRKGPDEKWRMTFFFLKTAVRGRPPDQLLRIAHFTTPGGYEHPVSRGDQANRLYLVALEWIDDRVFYLPPSGGELPLGMDPNELPRLDPTKQSEEEMLDRACAEAVAHGDDTTIASIILSTRFWRWKGPTPLLRSEIRHVTDSEDPTMAGLALAWLVTRDSPGILEKVKEYIASDPKVSVEDALFISLPSAIEGHIRDPKAVPILAEFANSPDAQLKRASLYCLREIASPETVPILAHHLDDADLADCYNCIMGLAKATGRGPDWGTTLIEFRTDPGPLTAKWREWWEQEGRQKYAPDKPAVRE